MRRQRMIAIAAFAVTHVVFWDLRQSRETSMHDILEPYRRSQRQKYAALQSQPVVTLTGIVGEDGVRGMQLDPDAPIELRLSFDAWRVEAGPVHNFSLNVYRSVSEGELNRLHDAIPPNTVVGISARVGEPGGAYSSAALLEEFLGVTTDDEDLNQRRKERLEPHTLHDDFFGSFVLDHKLYEYSVQADWNGRSVVLSVLPDEPFDFEAAVAVARALWDDSESWDSKVCAFAMKELLPLKNNHWLAADETPLSPRDFADQLKIWYISVCQAGRFTFHIDMGEMFTDHAVEVYGSLKDGLQGATING